MREWLETRVGCQDTISRARTQRVAVFVALSEHSPSPPIGETGNETSRDTSVKNQTHVHTVDSANVPLQRELHEVSTCARALLACVCGNHSNDAAEKVSFTSNALLSPPAKELRRGYLSFSTRAMYISASRYARPRVGARAASVRFGRNLRNCLHRTRTPEFHVEIAIVRVKDHFPVRLRLRVVHARHGFA